jgi:tripartite-type tricarboxylate transporter receptor subunit TctC
MIAARSCATGGKHGRTPTSFQPKTRDRFTNDGSEVIASAPEEFAALINAELARWVAAVKSAGMQRM